MKTFAIVLLCAFAAVQGRSTGVQVSNQRSLALRGENPWVVHLRLAVSTSGLLQTCAGSLIDASWVLTSADCVGDARFIWLRFAAVEVIRPELVLESSAVRVHQGWNSVSGSNNIAVIAVNRVIENSKNIAVIPLPSAEAELAESASLCTYGENEDNSPGYALSCSSVDIVSVNDASLIVDASVSKFDTGAALVSDGVQVGLVSRAGEAKGSAVVTRVDAYVDWISAQIGVQFGPIAAEPVIVVDN